MLQNITERLIYLCDIIPDKIRYIPENEFLTKPQINKWSKKEILGHLIDSATNNHQRFVRGQYEELPEIYYDQNNWNKVQDYQTEPTEQLIRFWENYNRHLAHIISKIPEEKLLLQCKGKDGSLTSVTFLIEDYLNHLEYHLKQLTAY